MTGNRLKTLPWRCSTPLLSGVLMCVMLQQPAAQEQTIPLYDSLGSFGRTINTSHPTAQQFFDQGLRLAYAFGREDAVRSFREAQRHDPECAMCYWGEAWALGPYRNSPMSEERSREAFAAIQKALSWTGNASGIEKALIEAMAVRYRKEPEPENRAELDRAYSAAMKDVVRRFPWDLDAGTLYAEALTSMRPRDLWTPEGMPRPETATAIAILESVLGRHIKHPGACHFYIHVVESSSSPSRAEACADLLGEAMPGASHIQHMPSHIHMRVGRYGDAVRANQRAVIADQRAALGEAAAIYPAHNLQMLAFAAAYDGQSSIAIQAARDHQEQSSDPVYLTQVLVRFGRWQELLDQQEPEDPFPRAIWLFGRGLASLRNGDPDRAREHLEGLEGHTGEADPEAEYRRSRQVDLLRIARALLAGEILSAEGRDQEAVGTFQEILAVQDGLPYSEPEAWLLPVRHYLGAALLERGQTAAAERQYRQELRHHPDNGWSLVGLGRSLRKQGRLDEASTIHRRFRKVWSRADVWLASSRF